MIAQFKTLSVKWSAVAATLVLLLATVTLTGMMKTTHATLDYSNLQFGPAVNTGIEGNHPELSLDGLTMYFWSTPAGQENYYVTRATLNDPWSVPVLVGLPYPNSGISASSDELTLYYCSLSGSGYGYWDLWSMSRPDATSGWSTPVNLGTNINNSRNQKYPDISSDGLTLYYEDHPVVGGQTVWEQSEILVSQREDINSPWQTPQPMESINGDAYDGHPSISSDGLILVFVSQRYGGYGEWDIWYSTRSSIEASWGTPLNAGINVNTVGPYSQAPDISLIDNKIYFHSVKDGKGYIFYSEIIPEPSMLLMGVAGMLGLMRTGRKQ